MPKFVRNPRRSNYGKKTVSTSIPGTSATGRWPSRLSAQAGTKNDSFKKGPTPFIAKNATGAAGLKKENKPFVAKAKTPTIVPQRSYGQAKPIKKAVKVAGPSPVPAADPYAFPMRLNKYLAFKGYATRRGADELIEKRRVMINGAYAVLGDKVQESDVVEVNNHKKIEAYVYYAYNKPRGVSTDETRKGTKSIAQSITLKGVFSVGHLDTNSSGLIILTNDRRISSRLFNNGFEHDTEYFVRTITPIRSNFAEKMSAGIPIGNGQTVRASVSNVDQHTFNLVTIGAGNHIRQLCATNFAEIEQLTRTRIMNVKLDRLQIGAFRKIEDEELTELLAGLGL